MKNKTEPTTRTVPGYPDYEVSACGRVFSSRTSERKEIKGSYNGAGYRQTSVTNPDGKCRHAFFHVLVAMAWLPNYDPSLQVNHIDGNKLNNHASNLELVTASKNARSFRIQNCNNTSGIRGVYVNRVNKTNPWIGKIKRLGKGYYTKSFPTREQAAFAWDVLALKFGYAKEALNYPENYHRYMWELNSQQTLKI